LAFSRIEKWQLGFQLDSGWGAFLWNDEPMKYLIGFE
jgi:hypothetical protein